MKQKRTWLLLWCLASLVILTSCAGGPDQIRLRAEKTSHALATRCADGWFGGLPWTPEDQRLVRQSLDDWASRLAADEAALGGPR